jgi:transposase
MLSWPAVVKLYLCATPTDMRKSFDSLAALASQVLHQDPLSGHVFIFRNKTGNRLKLLYWDRDGYAIWYKRLERGVFTWPPAQGDGRVEPRDLLLMLEGLKPAKMQRNNRFKLK